MNNTEKTQQNLDQIRAILKRDLRINNEQIDYIFKSMTDIERISPSQLDEVLSVLMTNYGIKPSQLNKLMCSNPPAELFNLENLLDKMVLFKTVVGASAANFKFALLNNPEAFAVSNDDLESYIFELKRDLGMDNRFVLNLLTRTNDFAHNIEDYIPLSKFKLDYLYAMGITPEQITAKPGILGNTISSISTRLMYALCNDISIDEYLDESLFLSTEAKVHARTAAYKAGLIKKEHIYVPESYFVGLTGYKTDDLKKLYPFNMHAKTKLLAEFGEKFPELSAISLVEYKRASELIHSYKQEQDARKSANGEQIPESPVAKRQEILNAIKTNLGDRTFSEKDKDIIIKNYDYLISIGYSPEEVIAYPKALLLTSDRLMWRSKLAKINGLSNHRFLTKGYKFKETIIFPRTCGVKILNTKTDTTFLQIYNSEPTFFKSFGESTEKLSEHCKLNQAGRNLLDKLYLQAIETESAQEENE